jgi:hypothetical protein
MQPSNSSERYEEKEMRYVIPLLGALFLSTTPAIGQVSIGIGLPGVSIGFNLPVYPQLVRIPGYPVYYAPQLGSNFFFYDGMYWIYQEDSWYASSWYNGPWEFVGPQAVPLYVLRIPVRYYRNPPEYFRGWRADAPPRWGDHWGNEWAQHRGGWDRWNRASAPAPAPLPAYQRQYSGERYPHQIEQQQAIHNQHYRYQPRDTPARQYDQAPPVGRAAMPAQPGRQEAPRDRPQQSPQRGGEDVDRAAAAQSTARPRNAADQDRGQPAWQAPAQHQQPAPESRQDNRPHDRGTPQEPGRSQGREMERESGDGRGQGQGQGRNRSPD